MNLVISVIAITRLLVLMKQRKDFVKTQFLFLTRGKRKISYFKYIYEKKTRSISLTIFLTQKADNVGLFELTRSTSSTLLTVLK